MFYATTPLLSLPARRCARQRPGVQTKATIKQAKPDQFVDKTLDRSTLWEMHTPQASPIPPKLRPPPQKWYLQLR